MRTGCAGLHVARLRNGRSEAFTMAIFDSQQAPMTVASTHPRTSHIINTEAQLRADQPVVSEIHHS